MPALTLHQRVTALSQAPQERRLERPAASADPADLCEQWLKYTAALLQRSHFSSTELEACRIGLRGYVRANPAAAAMLKRIDAAKERAWSA